MTEMKTSKSIIKTEVMICCKKVASLFSQILAQVARIDFEKLVMKHGAERSCKGFQKLDPVRGDVVLPACGLLHRDNVILTPHAAFYSSNSMEESYVRGMDHVKDFLQGRLDKISLVNRLDR